MEIISRKKARKLNLKRFFLDKECPHGHNVERLVSNGTCIKCSNIKSSLWIRKNYIIKFKTKRKDHYLNNKEHVSKTNRIYRNKNVEKINAYQKEWRLKNSERLKIMIKNWCRIKKNGIFIPNPYLYSLAKEGEEMKDIKSLTVKSLANGNMLIEVKYKKGLPGVMTRMEIARKIQEMLRKERK